MPSATSYAFDMPSWDDVAAMALALPDTEESTSYGNTAWKVRGKSFVWERPFSKADLKRLGGTGPEGPILAAYVDDLAEKAAVIAANPDTMFTIEHFNGFPAVLILLDPVGAETLAAAIIDAWLARAPKALVEEYLATR